MIPIGYGNSMSYETVKLTLSFGIIDDVRIYDRALSAEEVQALYNMGQ